jgi:CRISPR-associated endonuclease Cas2
VAYDAADDRRRNELRRRIQRFASGGQKSVFECWLTDAQADALASELAGCIHPKQDRVLFAWPRVDLGCFVKPSGGRVEAFQRFASSPKSRGTQASRLPESPWLLLAYDIACPRRLQKAHQLLRKAALHTQFSVFVLSMAVARQSERLAEVISLMRSNDDLRIYPIDAPDALWCFGRESLPNVLRPPTLLRRMLRGLGLGSDAP